MNTTNNNGVLEWAVTAVEGAQPQALSRPGPMSRAKIIEGDALEVLAAMPEHSVDMQIHDPPYSSGGFTRGDRMAMVTMHVTATSLGAAQDQALQDLINGQLQAGFHAIYTFV